jgi:quinol monooxygenase YgiN
MDGADPDLMAVDHRSDSTLTVVTLAFRTTEDTRLASILARYVVLSRGHPGCRNIDLCVSVTTPGQFLVIQKWESQAAQQAHFDSDEMVTMATACRGLLIEAPVIDLLDGLSAHDLA